MYDFQCESWCADSCESLNGDIVRECGDCDSVSEWPCHPGAPGFPEPPKSNILPRAQQKSRTDQNALRRCDNVRLSRERPTLVLILRPSSAGKTTLVRQIIDKRPVHHWSARSLGSCAWLESTSTAVFGHWRGFTHPDSLPACESDTCRGSLLSREGSDQLLRHHALTDELHANCGSALLGPLANWTRLVLSDGSSLIGANGKFDRRLLDLAEAAGFRVLLLEIKIDAALLYERWLRRDGKRLVWRQTWHLERLAEEHPSLVADHERAHAELSSDRRWRLCTAEEIRGILQPEEQGCAGSASASNG